MQFLHPNKISYEDKGRLKKLCPRVYNVQIEPSAVIIVIIMMTFRRRRVFRKRQTKFPLSTHETNDVWQKFDDEYVLRNLHAVRTVSASGEIHDIFPFYSISFYDSIRFLNLGVQL